MSKRKKVSFEAPKEVIYMFNKKVYDFHGIRWVLRARGTGKESLKLSFIEHENGRWTATDGHRLHHYESDGFVDYEDGIYKVVVNKVNEVVLRKDIDAPRFPNWHNVCPDASSWKKKFPIVVSDVDHDGTVAYTKIVREMKSNTMMINYFQDFISCGSYETFDVYMYDDNSAVCFWNNGNKFALIMPCRPG